MGELSLKPIDFDRPGQRLRPTIAFWTNGRGHLNEDLMTLMRIEPGTDGFSFFRDTACVGEFDPEEESIFVAAQPQGECQVDMFADAANGPQIRSTALMKALGLDPEEGWGLLVYPDSRSAEKVYDNGDPADEVLVYEAELVRRDDHEAF